MPTFPIQSSLCRRRAAVTGGALRVLMVAPSSVAGGSEALLNDLVLCGPEAGYVPSVLALEPGPLVDRLRAHDIPVACHGAGRLRDLRSQARTDRWSDIQIRCQDPDVVYSNMAKAHVLAALPASRAGVPSSWHQAGVPDPPHWLDRLASALPAARVMAVSSAGAAAQAKVRPGPTVTLVSPGIDLTRFSGNNAIAARRRLGLPVGVPLVGIVGRLQEWKGQREFLQAAAMVADRHPAAKFLVIGGALLGWEGDYPTRLEHLARDLGLADRTVFTGHREDVHLWLSALDVAVNASHPEPFGLVIVEAMAARCAVVAVAAGGPLDVIDHRQTGVLCATNRPSDLSAAIDFLLDDTATRTAIAEAGHRHVVSHFGADRMASDFATMLRDCLSGGNRSARERRE